MSGQVWITGAGSGIGEALACLFAERGCAVIASGRRLDILDALARRQPSITALALDVTDREAVAKAVNAMGPVDTAILCAGTHHPTPATRFNADEVRTLIETNLMGIVHCVEALLPSMIARGCGHLVLVASVAGYRGLPTAGGYCASKAAVIALAESLRLDLDGTGVRITLINPGFVDTPLTQKNPFPMPDIISAERAAQIIVSGLEQNDHFEIAFPRRFAMAMKVMRFLPYRLFFPLVRRVTGC